MLKVCSSASESHDWAPAFSGGDELVVRCVALYLFSCEEALGLALALLVTWVLADHHDSTVTTDDLALVADLLDAWVYLHGYYFLYL